MAPGQVPQQWLPWRDAHPFFLLSPLMGLFSRAWSRLRSPGALESWLVEAVTRADHGEAKVSLATYHGPGDRHPQVETGETRAAKENGEISWGACPDLEAGVSLLETWGLSEAAAERGRENTASVVREQGRECIGSHPVPLPPKLLIKSLQDLREEKSEEDGAVEGKEGSMFSLPVSPWESCPGVVDDAENGAAVHKEAPGTSTPSAPGSKLRVWVEEEDVVTEERRTEDKDATKTSISTPSAGSHPRAWECGPGEQFKEKRDEKAEEGEPHPGPHSSLLALRPQLRSWQHQPKEISVEDEEEEVEGDSVSGTAGGLTPVPLTSSFLRAWVYWPGEDTEEEEEDSDSEAHEDWGETEVLSSTPPTSACVRAWVYRPGEDTEEEEEDDSDLGVAEEEEEAEGLIPVPLTSASVRTWVYRPGEDTEEEEEAEEEDGDLGAAEEQGEAERLSSMPPTSAFLKAWVYRPGEDTEEEEEEENDENEDEDNSEAADSEPGPSLEEWGETMADPFAVAIYLPGEKPPPPWAPPRMPPRLQRRLRPVEVPTQHPEPRTPPKARKVRFSEKVSVHFLAVWAGPARAARQGPWEQMARDRSRFTRRIAQAERELGPCFTPAARARAWARLENLPRCLTARPVSSQTVPMSTIQATPLSQAVASAPPWPSASPGLNLSGKRG